jgi:hypothetical protein
VELYQTRNRRAVTVVGKLMIRCPVTAEKVPTGFSAVSSDMFRPSEVLVV